MPERIFTLEVSRPVTNIGPDHVLGLEERLRATAENPMAVSSAVSRLFEPTAALQAGIIAMVEFERLQRFLGDDRLDKRDVKDLGRHIEASMADRSSPRRVPLLPARLHRRGNGPHYDLTVAGSGQLVGQRRFVKELITEFVNNPYLPERIWFSDDSKAARVWFATARTAEEARLIGGLGGILEEDAEKPAALRLLPQDAAIGEINVRHSSRKV